MPDPLGAYRRSGADLPFGFPERAHGVAMEGHFWRFTHVATGRVIIALIGVQQTVRGPWALCGIGTSGGFWRQAVVEGAECRRLGLGARTLDGRFFGDDTRVAVDLGPDARLDVTISGQRRWPHRLFGGSSYFQSVPALNQYWHPWLLGGTADGGAVVDGERWDLSGAAVYGEKNWGRAGFPESWWWGQAHGFAEEEVCVAFAGGEVTAGPLRTEVTGLVVRLPDGAVLRLGNPVTSPVRATTSDSRWRLRARSARWQVDLDAEAEPAHALVLPVPLVEERRGTPGALEQLAGRMAVTVRRDGRVVWAGESDLAGLEHGGLARAEAAAARRRG
ncbi:tocopherol cyclase family protein [Tessaracoccus sp. ZS01]|uniref:tocopherol cyclase family protein n=1 Tax=Tessaracoccus sp. ZS01 TaxID=1906324 RepID=UPI00096CA653|nr:tocopherol cyclase family protein [Tessaracoccus sp. ZS01]MCG6567311.1 hypothetical protein [Tessaracoccus sp. ZS01]OMG57268.1 hypothetical protein BJN44_06700 [Tessaracoccus sp. ZS01]